MGGNTFLNNVPIKKEDINGTLKYISEVLTPLNISYDYLKSNLIGSAGKKKISGDLDVAIDKSIYLLEDINKVIRKKLGNEFVNSKAIKGGQLITLFPILGNKKYGLVQVDFILGNPNWIKFSHQSPGDKSDYPGVYISTTLGVLAKMTKDYEYYDKITKERIARVGLSLNLEKGLTRHWKLQKIKGQGLSKVDPNTWESKIHNGHKLPIRFTRLGYIDDPSVVVDILLPNINISQIETFENLYEIVKNHPKWRSRFKEFKDRLLTSIKKSGARKITDIQKNKLPDLFS